jgi:hypothetical protein
MEKKLWEQLGKINISNLSRLTGINKTRLWRVYNFGGLKLEEFEKLAKVANVHCWRCGEKIIREI